MNKYLEEYIHSSDKSKQAKIVLPVDYVVGDGFSETAKVNEKLAFIHSNSWNHFFQFKTANDTDKDSDGAIIGVPNNWIGLDVGPDSNKLFADIVTKAKTVLWNGYDFLYKD